MLGILYYINILARGKSGLYAGKPGANEFAVQDEGCACVCACVCVCCTVSLLPSVHASHTYSV